MSYWVKIKIDIIVSRFKLKTFGKYITKYSCYKLYRRNVCHKCHNEVRSTTFLEKAKKTNYVLYLRETVQLRSHVALLHCPHIN